MPREISVNRSIGDRVSAERLQNFNQEIDNLYANGDDIGRVSHAQSGDPLKVDIGSFPYFIHGNYGIYPGVLNLSIPDNSTKFIMVDSSGIVTLENTYDPDKALLAVVVSLSGSIVSIQNYKACVFGGFSGTGDVNGPSTAGAGNIPIFVNGKLIADSGLTINELIIEASKTISSFKGQGIAGEDIIQGNSLYEEGMDELVSLQVFSPGRGTGGGGSIYVGAGMQVSSFSATKTISVSGLYVTSAGGTPPSRAILYDAQGNTLDTVIFSIGTYNTIPVSFSKSFVFNAGDSFSIGIDNQGSGRSAYSPAGSGNYTGFSVSVSYGVSGLSYALLGMNLFPIGKDNTTKRISIREISNGISTNEISLGLNVIGTPGSDLNARIENESGTLLATGTVLVSSLTNVFSKITISLNTNLSLPKGSKYKIVLFRGTYGSETVDENNYFGLAYFEKHTSTRYIQKRNGISRSNIDELGLSYTKGSPITDSAGIKISTISDINIKGINLSQGFGLKIKDGSGTIIKTINKVGIKILNNVSKGGEFVVVGSYLYQIYGGTLYKIDIATKTVVGSVASGSTTIVTDGNYIYGGKAVTNIYGTYWDVYLQKISLNLNVDSEILLASGYAAGFGAGITLKYFGGYLYFVGFHYTSVIRSKYDVSDLTTPINTTTYHGAGNSLFPFCDRLIINDGTNINEMGSDLSFTKTIGASGDRSSVITDGNYMYGINGTTIKKYLYSDLSEINTRTLSTNITGFSITNGKYLISENNKIRDVSSDLSGTTTYLTSTNTKNICYIGGSYCIQDGINLIFNDNLSSKYIDVDYFFTAGNTYRIEVDFLGLGYIPLTVSSPKIPFLGYGVSGSYNGSDSNFYNIESIEQYGSSIPYSDSLGFQKFLLARSSASLSTKVPSRTMIAIENYQSGDTVSYDYSGTSSVLSGFTQDIDLYLGNVLGSVSSSPGTIPVRIGKTIDTNKILLDTNAPRIRTPLFLSVSGNNNITFTAKKRCIVYGNTVAGNTGIGGSTSIVNLYISADGINRNLVKQTAFGGQAYGFGYADGLALVLQSGQKMKIETSNASSATITGYVEF